MLQIQKTLKLNLADISEDNQKAAKQEIGDYLINETIRYMERGISPVAGEAPWVKLDKEYAKEEHAGNRTPTLNATGKLREALEFRTTDQGIEVGIMHKSQQAKADGHNNFSGKSYLPRRRFIPTSRQDYKSEIMAGVDRILNAYRSTDIDVAGEGLNLGSRSHPYHRHR